VFNKDVKDMPHRELKTLLIDLFKSANLYWLVVYYW
jgi:hypothetical protein